MVRFNCARCVYAFNDECPTMGMAKFCNSYKDAGRWSHRHLLKPEVRDYVAELYGPALVIHNPEGAQSDADQGTRFLSLPVLAQQPTGA